MPTNAPDIVAKNISLRKVVVNRLNELLQIANTAKDDPSDISQLKIRYLKIDSLYKQFESYHTKIINATLVESDDFIQQEIVRVDFDKTYFDIKTIYYELVDKIAEDAASLSSSSNSNNVPSGRLPLISLPHFTGTLKDWPNYRDLFTALVDKHPTLTNIEKFQYLLSSVAGEALEIVRSVTLSSDNYFIAFSNLNKRYNNKRLLAVSYWKEIHDFTKLEKENVVQLRKLLNVFSENLAALDVLEFSVDQWDFPLFNILLDKIDSPTRTRFELTHSQIDVPTYNDLYTFLSNQCKALEAVNFAKPTNSPKQAQTSNFKPNNNYRSNNKSSFIINTQITSQLNCSFCQSSTHSSTKCTSFLDLTPYNRYKLAKKHNLCLNCLRETHRLESCLSKSTCRICHSNRHHTMLHFTTACSNSFKSETPSNVKSSPVITSDEVPAENVPGASSNSNTALISNTCSSNSTVLLSTVEIKIVDGYGHKQKVRALLDNASQVSFITLRCLNKLGLKYTPIAAPIHGIGSSYSVYPKGKLFCNISSSYVSKPEFNIEVFVLPKICADMPQCSFNSDQWSHISTLKLADPNFHISRSVDMLLSADIFARVLLSGKIESPAENAPIALNTLFGWIISGRVNSTLPNPSTNLCSFITMIPDRCESLDNTLKKFWELESIPNHNIIAEEDTYCESIFKNTTTRNSEGRYIVDLPFRINVEPTFTNSREIALRSFYHLEQRLSKDKDLQMQYSDCIQNYLESGYMSPAPKLENPQLGFYLPHHCVVKLDSTTTKLRVVFNASQKCSNGQSLNDILHVGPKLQMDIITLLLRFRIYSVVFTADIRQMYLQILLSPRHRNYQRIFWRFSRNEPVHEYMLNTVTFGISCSPFLAIRVIQQLALDEGNDLPFAQTILENEIYVDNIISGCFSVEKAKTSIQQLIDIFGRGCFELRKWASNIPELLEFLPASSKEIPVDFDEGSFIKVLGLRWNPSKDSFTFKVNVLSKECTKRSILSELARIFDPLGFLAPLTFFAKYLTQTLWSLGLDWDQPPPEDIVLRWTQYKSELYHLSSLEIPRGLNIVDSPSCELHGFCDASQRGYACVAYFRIFNSDSSYRTIFIIAKSKVAPLSKISIPRLELCAAVLLADLIYFIQNTYSHLVQIKRTYAWSDSRVALSWIKSSPNRWKTFVGNRVARIHEKLNPSCWYHVRGTDNPADIASRGCLPLDLMNSPAWWAGPEFLKSPELPIDFSSNASDYTAEVLVEETKNVFTVTYESHPILNLLEKFSSLDKIHRIMAYCYKFINATKNKVKSTSDLTFIEIKLAQNTIIRIVQNQIFSEAIQKLKKKEVVSKALRSLCPFLDDQNILRVGGRLINSKLSYDQKFPILLPRQHRLTSLIIQDFHIKYLHPGLRSLQFLITQQFWILSPRRAIRSVLSNCFDCFRAKPRPLQPLMGDLPSFRVSQVKPFSCVGIDFGGPFFIKTSKLKGAKIQKAYLCLFVCCAVKAVHLELASDLTTDCFLAAFRRFLSRRGRVSHIHTDGGTNFVGASRYLLNIMRDAVSRENIKWSFNPPATPHFGGLFESGIKSVKTHLTRVLGEQILTFEEFYTLLVQIEAVLNSRPLIDISSDPNDLSVLTPGHFLTLEPLSALPDPDYTDVIANRLDRWQMLQRLHQEFWRRWHLEYLHSLTQRSKWTNPDTIINKNDLVLLKEDNLPPLKWKIGRIIELFPGRDNINRVATVRTASGTYKRGLAKLCLVPKGGH